MERFADLGGGGTSRGTSNASFLQLPLPAAASAQAIIPPGAQEDRSRLALQQLLADPSSSVPTVRHGHQKDGEVAQEEISPAEAETIKSKIMSHPLYSAILTAYLDCQKVGAPPEVSDKLSAVAAKLDAQQRQDRRRLPRADPELDQFMEVYCNMLVKYQEELARPIQEAAEFFKSVERQLGSFTDSSTCDGTGSSEDDHDTSCPEEVDPCAEDKELKHQLLKRYGGYLGGLRQEFSKRKKKGKLPKEARQKLLHWWELHYKWPYPSETEKIALAEATGLDQKQINNWFVNQRKRHWKPTSEDMPPFAMVMEGGFHAPPALYMDRPFLADGMYRLGS